MKAFKIKKNNEKKQFYIPDVVLYFKKPLFKRICFFKINRTPDYKNKYVEKDDIVRFKEIYNIFV